MLIPKSIYLSIWRNGEERRLNIKTGIRNVVGRPGQIHDPELNIPLDIGDGSISKRHCCITNSFVTGQGPVFFIEDLNSKSGTTVFDEQNRRMDLQGGDKIYLFDGYTLQVGNTRLRFRIRYKAGATKLGRHV